MNIDKNYIVIQGWMIQKLGLKPRELMAYALIYGFTQDGKPHKLSITYLSQWLRSTRKTTIATIKSLEEKRLIRKQSRKGKTGSENYYTTEKQETDTSVEITLPASVKITPPASVKTTPPASVKTTPPKYVILNSIPKDIDKKNKRESVKTDTTPTVEEVRELCKERLNGVDPDKFFNYYQARGWVSGKNGPKIKDWKAQLKVWETGEQEQYKREALLKKKAEEEEEERRRNEVKARSGLD